MTDTAGRSLVSAARAGIDRVSSFIHRPRSLHKARLWPRSSGGANVVGDLLPLVVFFVFFGVLSDRAVSAWTGTAPAAVDALANAVLIAVVWSIFAPIAMNGLAARRCIWLVVVVVAVPVLGPLMRHPGLLESDSILVEVVLSLVFAVWAAMVQHRAVAHATCLELASPFVDGRYAVIQGGASFTNQHASAPSQRLALDVVRVRILGPRLHGLVARRLGDYLIYGSTLVNPVAGTVVATRDGIDDRTGLRWPAQGNQVVAEPDGHPGWRASGLAGGALPPPVRQRPRRAWPAGSCRSANWAGWLVRQQQRTPSPLASQRRTGPPGGDPHRPATASASQRRGARPTARARDRRHRWRLTCRRCAGKHGRRWCEADRIGNSVSRATMHLPGCSFFHHPGARYAAPRRGCPFVVAKAARADPARRLSAECVGRCSPWFAG